MKKLGKFVGESVPIIDKNKKFIGIISENDVLNAYGQISEIIRNIEKKLEFSKAFIVYVVRYFIR